MSLTWAWEGKCTKHRAGSVAQVQRDPTQNLFDRHNFSAKVDSVVIPWDEKISNFTPIPFVRSLHCIFEKFKPFPSVERLQPQSIILQTKIIYLTKNHPIRYFRVTFRKNLIATIALRHGTEENRDESACLGRETNWSSRTRECRLKEVEKSWIWGQIRNWDNEKSFSFWVTDCRVERNGQKWSIGFWTKLKLKIYRASSVVSTGNYSRISQPSLLFYLFSPWQKVE